MTARFFPDGRARSTRRPLRPWLFCSILALPLAGCAPVTVERQRLVSKPNMQFTASPVFSYSAKTTSQLQPGLVGSAGAAPTSCAACR